MKVQAVIPLEYRGVKYFEGDYPGAVAMVLKDLQTTLKEEGLQANGKPKVFIRYTMNLVGLEHYQDRFLVAEAEAEIYTHKRTDPALQ
jgi:hypothetical protein